MTNREAAEQLMRHFFSPGDPQWSSKLGTLTTALDAAERHGLERAMADRADRALSMPNGLHPETATLVQLFAGALARKLHKAELKYGYSNGWADPDWEAECRARLMEHIDKGDPRDVAAYCAFMWRHGWRTGPNPLAARVATLETDLARARENARESRRVQDAFVARVAALEARIQRVVDHIDIAAGGEMYTNDADLIATVRAILTPRDGGDSP